MDLRDYAMLPQLTGLDFGRGGLLNHIYCHTVTMCLQGTNKQQNIFNMWKQGIQLEIPRKY